MGDISEMRALIVLFVLVAVTISLIVLIPTQFYTAAIENAEAPDTSDLNPYLTWNSTYPANMTYTSYAAEVQNFQLNGYNFALGVYGQDDEPKIALRTYAQFLFFYWDTDDFDWLKDNVQVSEDMTWLSNTFPAISAETIDEYDAPQAFVCRNSHTQVSVTFYYNVTDYSSFEEALRNDDASLVFLVELDDRGTSLNVLQLIGMILTGGLPDLHPALSVVFGVVGWAIVAAGAYLIFIFALRVIGAVFGGGGA